ncbi:hypothetical protein HD554DRAFT_2320517 [Boletus coccyginus]|nr:hypothetical protein HD554DRAFT_2320517 [Boletus coccyginus]
MPPAAHRSRQRADFQPLMVQCCHCGNSFKAQGLKKHEKSCQNHVHSTLNQARYVREFEEERQRAQEVQDLMSGPAAGATAYITPNPGSELAVPGPGRISLSSPTQSVVDAADPHVWHSDHADAYMEQCVGGGSQSSISSDASMHDVGSSAAHSASPRGSDVEVAADFKTEYHPQSSHPPLFQSTEDFGCLATSAVQPDEQPWRPFKTEADLEFADVVIQAGLNASHVNALLGIILSVANKRASVTFKNEKELHLACDQAAQELTPKELKTFEVHVRSLWDWALDLLNNPLVAPDFVWDAQRLYRYDGEEYKHFYTEPWTGDHWWDIQSCLPNVPNAVPFGFILYADKTRLSSHGTVKAYPVMAWCANLLIDIRNGEHFGGGCIVGWLPIVPEPAKDEHKTSWTNFKRVIWHESFIILLEDLFQLSQTGYKHKCYDEVEHWLFPLILILSADYEELCMMTLIRGAKGKCPCPKKSQGEEILKALGLRLVENVFWKQAASFDCLHYLHDGLWGKHMLEELKTILKALGQEVSAIVEGRVSDFPRWHNLAHFDTVMHITFSDGNKLRDLVKQVFYAALDVLTEVSSPEGYRLFLIGLDVHTDETLAMIEEELLVFSDELQLKKYINAAERSDITTLKLDWDFLKAHLWKYVVWDIRTKGVTRNYSTRPNEKMHGALKDVYADRTNGKDIEKQFTSSIKILHVDHHRLAIKLLRGRMEAESECQSANMVQDEDDAEVSESIADKLAPGLPGPACMHLGSPCPSLSTISEIEDVHRGDRAFEGLRRKFIEFVNGCLPSYGIQLGGWTRKKHTAFVRLIFAFKCTIMESDFRFVLVQPYTARISSQCRLDRDLKLSHVRAVPRSQTIFIPVDSIIRGALLYPNPTSHDDFFIVDHIDGDMFLRTMSMKRSRTV